MGFIFPGIFYFSGLPKLAMIPGWKNAVVCRMHIASQALNRKRRFAASLATRRFALSAYVAAKKNLLRCLRPEPSDFLRPQVAPRPGPVVWRHQGLPGGGGAARLVPE